MRDDTRFDIFRFKGAKTLNGTIGNSALTNGSSGSDLRAAVFTSNAHGLLAGSDIFFQNLANNDYNGLRSIHAVATNTITIKLAPNQPYAALTPAGTELWFCGVWYPVDWLLLGFDLHLSAASATSENLVLSRDADAGTHYDTNLYTKDMNAVQDIVYMLDIPFPMSGKDVAKFTWANTNSRTWGLTVYAREKE
jgi:hypothetical protein